MKVYKNMPKVVGIAIETVYCLRNMNLLVYHVDSM